MTEDDKKELLSSDEKGAATSTLGGAVAGAVVGTVVGTPVVGTLIGAVSGAVIGARKRRSKTSADQTAHKGKDTHRKKPCSSQIHCQEVQVCVKAKDGNKVFKGFNTKGHKAGIANRPR